MARSTRPFSEHDVIIEFRQIGKSMRVSAMDPRTLTEVTIVGPAEATEAELKRNVVKKLEYVLAKKEMDGGR